MLLSTMELIIQATSNSLVVFFFCNLIIAILLVSSSKPGSDFDHEDNASPLPVVVANRNKSDNKKGLNADNSFDENKDLMDDSEVSNAQIALINDSKKNSNDNGNNDDDHDDDELRRRVEEFIDKVNRGWRAEKLRNSASVPVENWQLGLCTSCAI